MSSDFQRDSLNAHKQYHFCNPSQSYADVIINDDGVDTSQFLEATEGVIKLFDLLGNAAFVIVQNDMSGNVKVSIRIELGSDCCQSPA